MMEIKFSNTINVKCTKVNENEKLIDIIYRMSNKPKSYKFPKNLNELLHIIDFLPKGTYYLIGVEGESKLELNRLTWEEFNKSLVEIYNG